MKSSKFYKNSKVFTTEDDNVYSLTADDITEEIIDTIMQSEHSILCKNDIYTKSNVVLPFEIKLKKCTNQIPKGYKYVSETFNEHLKKDFVDINVEEYIQIFKNDSFTIYQIEKDEKFLTVFNEPTSFRNFDDFVNLKVAKELTDAFFFEPDYNKLVSYFIYDGIKTNFHFYTQTTKKLFFPAFPIFLDDFIRNAKRYPGYYKKDVNYVETIY